MTMWWKRSSGFLLAATLLLSCSGREGSSHASGYGIKDRNWTSGKVVTTDGTRTVAGELGARPIGQAAPSSDGVYTLRAGNAVRSK